MKLLATTPSVVAWLAATVASPVVVSGTRAPVSATATAAMHSLLLLPATDTLHGRLVRLLQHGGLAHARGVVIGLAHRLHILVHLVAPVVARILRTASTSVSEMHHSELSGVWVELVPVQAGQRRGRTFRSLKLREGKAEGFVFLVFAYNALFLQARAMSLRVALKHAQANEHQ